MTAWMRHRTTAYDRMAFPRVNGMRREVRRLLAGHPVELLDAYRAGWDIDAMNCPLQQPTTAKANISDRRSA